MTQALERESRMTLDKVGRVRNLVIGTLLILLGLAGLLLPILPGVIFLGLALIVISRTSVRLRRITEKVPFLQQIERKLRVVNALRFTDQVKFVALTTISLTSRSIDSAIRFFQRAVHRRT